MKAGFLLSLTEPSLRRPSRARCSPRPRRSAHAAATNASATHLAALRQPRRRRLGRRGRALGARPARGIRATRSPCSGLHLFDFYRGDAMQLPGTSRRVLPAWPDDDPLQPYVLALHAFGLEESGRYDEAEATGRRALAGAARVPWAIHAVAHVMEMQGRHEEGARWMGEWRARLGRARRRKAATARPNGFAGHLGWHEALFALEGARHRARRSRVFDDYLDASPDRDHAAARRRRGAALAPAPARRRRRRSLAARWSLAGRSTPRRPAARSSTTRTRRWR